MRRTLTIAAALTAHTPVLAQALPDINDAAVQSQQITDAVDRATQRRTQAESDVDSVDGEAGVYILRLNEIFSVSASGGLGYTDNPLRTADNPEGSGYADFGVAAGVSTVIGGTIDLGVSASVGGREYFEAFAPSTRTLSGNVSVGAPLGHTPLYLGVVGFGGFSYDGKFRGATSFYGASASLSATLPLNKRFVLRPGAGVTRQWSGTEENNSTSLSGSLELLAALAPTLTASLRAGVTRRWYDDFYENVTFVKRRDWQYQLGATLAWRATRTLSVAVSAGYERQDSSFFLSNYDALDATAGISFRLAF